MTILMMRPFNALKEAAFICHIHYSTCIYRKFRVGDQRAWSTVTQCPWSKIKNLAH